jgi:hypothetical protein
VSEFGEAKVHLPTFPLLVLQDKQVRAQQDAAIMLLKEELCGCSDKTV